MLDHRADVSVDPPIDPDECDCAPTARERRSLWPSLMSRRGALAVGAVSATLRIPAFAQAPAPTAKSAFNFVEIEAGSDEKHHVAQGYDADILIRWGDPVLPGAPAFDPTKQTAAGQKLQFGYNNDYVAFFPIGNAGDRGLLCVNHEYVDPEAMFPGIKRVSRTNFSEITEAHVAVEMAAHGVTVAEIVREGERWRPVLEGK